MCCRKITAVAGPGDGGELPERPLVPGGAAVISWELGTPTVGDGGRTVAGGDVDDAARAWGTQPSGGAEAAVADPVAAGRDAAQPPAPLMPSPPPFPAFHSRPSLPHQAPGGGFESGRHSRAR
jgi:hypothetical protein